MIKIKFDVTHKVQQGDGKGPVYEKDKTYEFSGLAAESYARKYILRGYAHEVKVAPATLDRARADEAERGRAEAERVAAEAAKLAERGAVALPDDVEALAWPELRALAAKLTDDTVHNKHEALAAIEAERGRRAVAG